MDVDDAHSVVNNHPVDNSLRVLNRTINGSDNWTRVCKSNRKRKRSELETISEIGSIYDQDQFLYLPGSPNKELSDELCSSYRDYDETSQGSMKAQTPSPMAGFQEYIRNRDSPGLGPNYEMDLGY